MTRGAEGANEANRDSEAAAASSSAQAQIEPLKEMRDLLRQILQQGQPRMIYRDPDRDNRGNMLTGSS